MGSFTRDRFVSLQGLKDVEDGLAGFLRSVRLDVLEGGWEGEARRRIGWEGVACGEGDQKEDWGDGERGGI
jgi:hypothetical protein